MKLTYLLLILNTIFLLLFSCLKRQSHEITAPEIPHYAVSGIVSDLDAGAELPGCEVTLEVVSLAFPEENFSDTTVTTDSTGRFLFESVIPGQFEIAIKRDGFFVQRERFLLEFQPKDIELPVPKPLITYDFYPSSQYKKSSGIHWTYINKMARIILWNLTEWGDNRTSGYRVDEGNFDVGFTVHGKRALRPENPVMQGLTFLTNYWATSPAKPVVYAVNTGDSRVFSEYEVPYQLEDLTASQTNLWASTFSGHIIKFGDHPGKVEFDFQLPDEKFGGIAWDKKSIWVAEMSQELIIKRDADMHPVLNYRPVYVDPRQRQQMVTPLSFLAFDFYGNLWVANDTGFYKFEMPE